MIDAKILIEAGIDHDASMERFMDNAEFYEAVLDAFLGETMLERAQSAYADGDYDKLEMAVHEAKGAGGNAGLNRLYIAAGSLLDLLRNDSYNQEQLEICFKIFVDTYLLTRNAIKSAIKGRNPK